MTLDEVKAVVLDLDGTVYYGDELIDGAKQTIDYLKNKGIKIFYCTNNSTKTKLQLKDKLNKLGIECDAASIYSSGTSTVRYLESLSAGRVWVIGSEELRDMISRNNVMCATPEETETLVVGMDPQYDYGKITNGVRAAMKAERIVFCGEDPYFLGTDRQLFPGCAAMTATIRACSKREPDIIIGKPHSFILECILKDNGLNKKDVVVIGDSYDCDMMFAKNNGVKGIHIGCNKDCDFPCISSLRDVMTNQLI